MKMDDVHNLDQRLQQAVEFIRHKSQKKPKLGIVLGSGLGTFVDSIQVDVAIPYKDIPNFASSTVEGHSGKLIIGSVDGVDVLILQGRVHFYEGHSMDQVVFPVRTLFMLGIESLILTNAAGGLDPQMEAGSFMILTDHINLMGTNPLVGPNLKHLGPRFPDMTEAYDPKLMETMEVIFKKFSIDFSKGVYCGVSGPTYETPAEVRYLRMIGGHAVGMSTVPEVIAANHMGVRVAAVSCITNAAAAIGNKKLTHDEVTETAKLVQVQFKQFLTEFVKTFKK